MDLFWNLNAKNCTPSIIDQQKNIAQTTYLKHKEEEQPGM